MLQCTAAGWPIALRIYLLTRPKWASLESSWHCFHTGEKLFIDDIGFANQSFVVARVSNSCVVKWRNKLTDDKPAPSSRSNLFIPRTTPDPLRHDSIIAATAIVNDNALILFSQSKTHSSIRNFVRLWPFAMPEERGVLR